MLLFIQERRNREFDKMHPLLRNTSLDTWWSEHHCCVSCCRATQKLVSANFKSLSEGKTPTKYCGLLQLIKATHPVSTLPVCCWKCFSWLWAGLWHRWWPCSVQHCWAGVCWLGLLRPCALPAPFPAYRVPPVLVQGLGAGRRKWNLLPVLLSVLCWHGWSGCDWVW